MGRAYERYMYNCAYLNVSKICEFKTSVGRNIMHYLTVLYGIHVAVRPAINILEGHLNIKTRPF